MLQPTASGVINISIWKVTIVEETSVNFLNGEIESPEVT